MRHARMIVAMAMLAAASAGAPARAQAPIQQQSDSDRADALVRQGTALGKKDKWKEAEALFRKAWALKRSYDIGGNLGLAEAALGKHREAAGHLRFALDGFPANGKPEHRKLLELTFAKVRAEVGALSIEVDVRGAVVLVDGEEVGFAPLGGEVYVDPGRRTVEAQAAGYDVAKQEVEVAMGGSAPVKLTLSPIAASEPKPVPKEMGKANGAPRGGSTETPVEQPGPRLIPIAVGGAVAAVALGVGVGLTVAANGKAGDAEDLRRQVGPSTACAPTATAMAGACADLSDALSSKDTLSNAAVASFVIGGLAALGTGGFAAWELSRTRGGAEVRAAPAVGMRGGGVVVVGSW